MKNKKAGISKSEACIAMFMAVLVVTMPIVFTALQPEFINGEVKQNSVIGEIAFGLKKIISILNPLNLIPSASALPDTGCCEIMKANSAFCQDKVISDDCVPGKWHQGASCSDVCLGCCANATSGTCNTNTFKVDNFGCYGGGSIFIRGDLNCEQLPACKKGCCTIGYEKRLETNRTCVEELHGSWDGSITDWTTCAQSITTDTRGCCRYNCKYGTAGECAASTGFTVQELQSSGFFVLNECYDNVPGCELCVKDRQKCINGSQELYNADSCGNAYIDDIARSCTNHNEICVVHQDQQNDSCESMNCNRIYSNYESHSDFDNLIYINFEPEWKTGMDIPNGASWCVYDTDLDAPPAIGTSTRGSVQYKFTCLYGKQYVESCGDGRTSICVETNGTCYDPNGVDQTCLGKSQSECASGTCQWISAHAAACIPNLYTSCVNITNKDECNNNSFCYWWTTWQDLPPTREMLINVGFNLTEKPLENWTKNWYGLDPLNKPVSPQPQLCMPKWPIDYGENTEVTAETACGAATIVCPYASNIFKTDNSECKDKMWDVLMMESCRSVGNCGLWKNWIYDTVGVGSVKKIGVGDMPTDPNTARGRNISTPTEYMNYVNNLNSTHPTWSWQRSVGHIFIGTAAVLLAVFAILAGSSASILGFGFEVWVYNIGGAWLANIFGAAAINPSTAVGLFSGSWTGASGALAGVTGILIGVAVIFAGVMMITWADRFPVGSAAHNLLLTGGSTLMAVGTVLILAAIFPIPGLGWVIGGVALLTMGIMQLLYWLTYEHEYYVVQCAPSRAPYGAANCHRCNEDPLRPCSQARCEALGLGCMFNDTINWGGEPRPLGDGMCMESYNTGRQPWITNMTVIDDHGTFYKINPTPITTFAPQTITISRPDGSAIPDGTILFTTIHLNERSFCEWDTQSTQNITSMANHYGGGVFGLEMTDPLYGASLRQNTYYVRCVNAYGNANTAEYIFRFTTTIGPDQTPPYIIAVDPADGWEFSNTMQAQNITMTAYLGLDASPPVNCTFSRTNGLQSYDMMKAETAAECESRLIGPNIGCEFFNVSLIAGQENSFYIKCKDNLNNTMPDSFGVTYYPAPALVITSIDPAEGSRYPGCSLNTKQILTVTTAEGSDNGNATCQWTNWSDYTHLTYFGETHSTTHVANVTLVSSGPQTLYVECYDTAMNTARINTTFYIDVDSIAPNITRMYKDSGSLVIQTNEQATCAYNRGNGGSNCSFSAIHWYNAINFSTSDGFMHTTEWIKIQGLGDDWYVRCYDACLNGANATTVPGCVRIIPQDIEE